MDDSLFSLGLLLERYKTMLMVFEKGSGQLINKENCFVLF